MSKSSFGDADSIAHSYVLEVLVIESSLDGTNLQSQDLGILSG